MKQEEISSSMKSIGVLRMKSDKPFSPALKIVKPNNKTINKKVVAGLKVFLKEQKDLDKIRKVVYK
jgi:hypothetical protein